MSLNSCCILVHHQLLKIGPGLERAQRVRCFVYKQEDLSVGPNTHIKAVWWHVFVIPMWVGVVILWRLGRSWRVAGWAA